MDIILSTEGIDEQECDVLVAGFFQDERPLRGSSGWIDWRFNGMLSHFLIEKNLTGGWKETTLIPSQGRVVPSMVLLFGLGKVKEYSYLRLRELSSYLLETLEKLKRRGSHQTANNRSIRASHCILYCIGYQEKDDKIKRRHLSDLPLPGKSHTNENSSVDDSGAEEDFKNRRYGSEHDLVPSRT